MSTNSPYRYRYAAVAPRPQPAPLLRILAIVGAGLTALVVIAVLVYGIQLARAPRPVAQPTAAAQAVQPAALSSAAVAPAAADTIEGMPLDAFWARYQTATAWHVVAHTDDGWVYFCDGDRNGGTFWRKCGASGHCDDTACAFPSQAAVDDFYNRLIQDYHVEGAQVLNPLGYTPPPAPLGARSGWDGKRALPPGEVK